MFKWTVVLAVLAILPSVSAPAQTETTKKKLIEYGWDVPTPDFVRKNIREMEKKPFDGIVLRLKAGMNMLQRKPADPAKYTEDMANLQAIDFQRFTDNFIIMWSAAQEGWDWFSDADWRAAESYINLSAKAAVAGRCRGICFDPEPYGLNPWHYPKQPAASKHSFAEYEKQVRKRGSEYIRTLQKSMPHLRLLTFFQLSLFTQIADMPNADDRDNRLKNNEYGLLPAFINGMLDGAREDTRIVDGNEPSYYYEKSEPFFRVYHAMRQNVLSLVAPELRAKYAGIMQAGQALYMDQIYNKRQPESNFISSILSPEERNRWFEHNVYYALYTSDEYVWCYSERMSWWENQLPDGAEDAIRRAEAKIVKGEPLGFEVDDTNAAARRRLQSK